MLMQPRSRPEQDPGDVLTLAEAAKLLKVCEKTTGKLAQTGELPARRVGNQWRFSRRAVLAHLEGEAAGETTGERFIQESPLDVFRLLHEFRTSGKLPATYFGEPNAAADTIAAATDAAEECGRG